MNNQTDTQDTYPPLPEPVELVNGEACAFTEAQMYAFVDADRTLRAGQREPVAPYCWQECAEDGTPFFDEGTFASTPDAFDYSRPLYIGGAGQSPTVPTAELLFEIANELHGEFDKQTYDEKRRAEWDLQDGDEFSVSITFKQERALSQAIYQFEKARAALRSTLPQTTGGKGS